MDLKDIQLEYLQDELHIKDLNPNPVLQLQTWMEQITSAEVSYPNAATLGTYSKEQFPQTRIILVKEIDETGISFFTDYRSHKAQDIENNSKVSLLFFWKEFDRQVRITGLAKKMEPEQSKKYFQSRPRESQISAWSSHQSQANNKEQLYANVEATKEKFKDQDPLPLPDFWGGYIIEYRSFEFWQGRPNRLHDRFYYNLENNNWKIERLDP